MAYVILSIALGIALFGWIKNRIAALSLCYFMLIKNYPPPTDEEMRASSAYVLRHLVGLENEL